MAGNLLAGLVGLALGSFLNVIISRLPRGEPMWAGRSRCPQCRTILSWHDNLPLLSFIWLRRRCRFCGAPIPWRYLIVELTCGLLGIALWLTFPAITLLLAYGLFCLALVALSAIDLEHRLLPDAITIPGIILGIGLAVVLPQLSLVSALAGAGLGGLWLWGIGWAYERMTGRRGMGGGDVKLMAMIGAFLGVHSLPLVVLISAGAGTLAGVLLLIVQGQWRQSQWRSTPIPFGPFLSAGALVYLFGGEKISRLLEIGVQTLISCGVSGLS